MGRNDYPSASYVRAVRNDYWSIPIINILLNDLAIAAEPVKAEAVLDTGTSLSILPISIYSILDTEIFSHHCRTYIRTFSVT